MERVGASVMTNPHLVLYCLFFTCYSIRWHIMLTSAAKYQFHDLISKQKKRGENNSESGHNFTTQLEKVHIGLNYCNHELGVEHSSCSDQYLTFESTFPF